METSTGRKYELRQITFDERSGLNDNHSGKELPKFSFWAKYVKCALGEIDGVKITDENREEMLMTLNSIEVTEIGLEAFQRFNIDVKKKSS